MVYFERFEELVETFGTFFTMTDKVYSFESKKRSIKSLFEPLFLFFLWRPECSDPNTQHHQCAANHKL